MAIFSRFYLGFSEDSGQLPGFQGKLRSRDRDREEEEKKKKKKKKTKKKKKKTKKEKKKTTNNHPYYRHAVRTLTHSQTTASTTAAAAATTTVTTTAVTERTITPERPAATQCRRNIITGTRIAGWSCQGSATINGEASNRATAAATVIATGRRIHIEQSARLVRVVS